MGKKYIKCPRCELNYILEGEDYCAICKSEMQFHADGEDEILDIEDMELCPVCGQNYIKEGEAMCEDCHKKGGDDEESDEPVAKLWRKGDKEDGITPVSDIDHDDDEDDYDEEMEDDDPYKTEDDDILEDDDLLDDEPIAFEEDDLDDDDDEIVSVADDFEIVEPLDGDEDEDEDDEDEDEDDDLLSKSKR